MRVRLSYGLDGLDVDVPDDAAVVYPNEAEAVADPAAEVLGALRAPVSGPALRDLVQRARRSPSRSATVPAPSPGRS